MQHPVSDPALTVAVALAAGMLAQALARHLGLPGIVVLLAAGVLLGPDALGLVRPQDLGPALHALVGFAVAVILFEGALNLNVARLRREARSIRQMVTLGAVVTAAGGTLAARLLLGWSWQLALLFGTLVIVTGPTVINPLLRRIRVQRKVATVLEAEGIFGDAIGALIAVVTLELVLSPAAGTWITSGAAGFSARLAFGALAGLAGGLVLVSLMRFDRLIPEGIENVVVLSTVLVLYQASNHAVPESGIVAVILAGLVVGNVQTRLTGGLREFKEQLTVLFIGLLFVLLAADVRLADVRGLGWRGVATVLALMLVVRPANVLAGTFGSNLTWRERAFLAWLAPRGIVAAAVSSLFARALDEAGIPGGTELRALVFLVIATTVVLQGLTGGLVAGRLGLRRVPSGFVALGANGLGIAFAGILRRGGHEVVFLDSNPDACRAAEEAGFRALHGSALDEELLQEAELDARLGCLAVTPNEEVNLLFARAARELKVPRVWVAVRRGHLSVQSEMVLRAGAHVLFGEPVGVAEWSARLERGAARVEAWRRAGPGAGPDIRGEGFDLALLPLAVRRGGDLLPVDESLAFRPGDELWVAVAADRAAEAEDALAAGGWQPAAAGE